MNRNRKNLIKTSIVSSLFMTAGALNNNSTLQQQSVASSIKLNQGTGVNYTSQQQLANIQKYLISYSLHNYTGHYDPTKHTHEQNVRALWKSLLIRAK